MDHARPNSFATRWAFFNDHCIEWTRNSVQNNLFYEVIFTTKNSLKFSAIFYIWKKREWSSNVFLQVKLFCLFFLHSHLDSCNQFNFPVDVILPDVTRTLKLNLSAYKSNICFRQPQPNFSQCDTKAAANSLK